MFSVRLIFFIQKFSWIREIKRIRNTGPWLLEVLGTCIISKRIQIFTTESVCKFCYEIFHDRLDAGTGTRIKKTVPGTYLLYEILKKTIRRVPVPTTINWGQNPGPQFLFAITIRKGDADPNNHQENYQHYWNRYRSFTEVSSLIPVPVPHRTWLRRWAAW